MRNDEEDVEILLCRDRSICKHQETDRGKLRSIMRNANFNWYKLGTVFIIIINSGQVIC
jgi:hypothetical protein